MYLKRRTSRPLHGLLGCPQTPRLSSRRPEGPCGWRRKCAFAAEAPEWPNEPPRWELLPIICSAEFSCRNPCDSLFYSSYCWTLPWNTSGQEEVPPRAITETLSIAATYELCTVFCYDLNREKTTGAVISLDIVPQRLRRVNDSCVHRQFHP